MKVAKFKVFEAISGGNKIPDIRPDTRVWASGIPYPPGTIFFGYLDTLVWRLRWDVDKAISKEFRVPALIVVTQVVSKKNHPYNNWISTLCMYRVFNKLDDIFSRLLNQLGISFLLYYGCVLDAKGCQFIVSFSVLWNSTFLKLLVDQDILNCPALSWVNIAAVGL